MSYICTNEIRNLKIHKMKNSQNNQFYCIKTFEMNSGKIAFKKGVTYIRTNAGHDLFTSEISENHSMTYSQRKDYLISVTQ